MQEQYSNASRQQWKITKSSSGNFVLRPKSAEVYETDWCIGADSQIDNGADAPSVEQQAYVNNSVHNDEWTLFDQSNLLALMDSQNTQRDAYFTPTKQILGMEKNRTFSYVLLRGYSALSATEAIDYLQDCSIFIIHTHGSKTSFQISNAGTNIDIFDLDGEDLSNLSFALLLTCNTGVDYHPDHITNNAPVNIIEKMVVCGAETVVGFNETTSVSDCNRFAPDIMSLLIGNGLSVEDAINSIDYSSYSENLSDIAVIAGNKDNKLA